ncbi:MAG: hypothetical protein IJ684_07090 [Bacteroidales bacterium]|nr:hypothetical protein [Bacteroidales bacterium]MBR1645116.1 hypothetical protein [Bacteroidales bacterium]
MPEDAVTDSFVTASELFYHGISQDLSQHLAGFITASRRILLRILLNQEGISPEDKGTSSDR